MPEIGRWSANVVRVLACYGATLDQADVFPDSKPQFASMFPGTQPHGRVAE